MTATECRPMKGSDAMTLRRIWMLPVALLLIVGTLGCGDNTTECRGDAGMNDDSQQINQDGPYDVQILAKGMVNGWQADVLL